MIFTLEELKDTIMLFSVNQCNFLTENCIVALEECNHKCGCKMEIIGDKKSEVFIFWSSKFNKAGYIETKKIVEHGATAISFFLARSFTDYTLIEEAVIGTGFDYWLGYNSNHLKYNPKNFLSARLEISGILIESSSNSIKERIRIKKNQTAVTDPLKLPAYISIVEFSKPKAYFAMK
jgi:hypothetical protein